MKILVVVFMIFVFSNGCGYNFGFRSSELLKGKDTFCVISVKNPTTNLQLGALLRNYFRDEFTKRMGFVWSSCDKADVLLAVDILSYSDVTKVESEKERTLKSELELKIKGFLLDGKSKREIWKSGVITARESYSTQSKTNAEYQVIRDVVEIFVERLTGAF